MVRRKRLFFIGFVLAIALSGGNIFSSEAFAQKVNETIAYRPTTLDLFAEPKVITVCEDQGTSSVVSLNARARSTDGNPIRYIWRTSGGRIQGAGPEVTWDLSGLRPGYYRAFVDIKTGNGEELCEAFASTRVLVNKCPPPALVCPTISISCPDNPSVDQPVEFKATVTGGPPNVERIYNWTLSAGTITSGQGTDSIRVDTAGLEGRSVRASLAIGGFPMDCSASCVVQFPVPVGCRRFDEFPDIARNDEKARLDNYAIELKNDPTATAHVFVYPGENGRPGDVQRHITRVVDYLINSRGLEARRIVTLVGPPRGELMVELWTCPPGGKPPMSER